MNEEREIPKVNGKVILLYQNTERESMEHARKILEECGVIPIACENPNNFRFVVPEIVVSANVDLIGRLALQSLGETSPVTTFGHAVRRALAPPLPNPTKVSK